MPLAWSGQPPRTPAQSPTERGDGTCYLGPEEGTRPCPAPGLPGPSLTVPRAPPVPLPGELLRPHPHLDIEGCPSPAPELPTSLRTCRGVLPDLPKGRKLICGCPAGRRQSRDANSSLAGSSLCPSPLVTSLQAMARPCLKAGLLYPLEPKKKLKLLGHTGPQNTCSAAWAHQAGSKEEEACGSRHNKKEREAAEFAQENGGKTRCREASLGPELQRGALDPAQPHRRPPQHLCLGTCPGQQGSAGERRLPVSQGYQALPPQASWEPPCQASRCSPQVWRRESLQGSKDIKRRRS